MYTKFKRGDSGINSRLGIKLLIILLSCILLSFGVLTFFIIKKERAILTEFNNEKSSLLARTITESLKEAMLEKDPSILKRVLSSHNSIRGMKAAVFGNDGTLVYGEFDYKIPEDVFGSSIEKTVETDKSLVFFKPLLNERRCQYCHPAKDRIRGIVAIEISNEKLKKELDETVTRIASFAIIIVILSGLILLLVLRRVILNPINLLKEGSVKLREGKLSHRIKVKSRDELGALAEAFNQMAEEIENAQKNLEDAINRRTKELRVIAELSTNVFRGDLTLNEIMESFISSIIDELDYSFCIISFLDKEKGVLLYGYKKGLKNGYFSKELSLDSDDPIVKIFCEATPVVKEAQEVGLRDINGYIAVIPIISHRRGRCKEINLCQYKDCPAFDSADERCWLIKGTLCSKHNNFKVNSKPSECIRCSAFPLIGVLTVGTYGDTEIGSIHSLEILASEIASAVENYRLIKNQKEDIETLIKLHDITVERLQYLNMDQLSESIVSVSLSLFPRFDASMLWLKVKDDRLYFINASGVDKSSIPYSVPIDSQNPIGQAVIEDRVVEIVDMNSLGTLKKIAEREGFVYSVFVPMKLKNSIIGCLAFFKNRDFPMNASERATITLFSTQAASAISIARLYEELKNEKDFSDAIFNHTVSGIMVLDKEGRIVKINRAAVEILQVLPKEVMNKRVEEIHPGLKDMLFITAGSREIDIASKSGVPRTIGYINSPLFDKDGREKGIIVVFRDITDIKRLQAEIRKKQHFEALGKVISGVAHEIRNPLFAVHSIAQILEREIDSESHQLLIQTMLKETNRMKRLVDELLFYSRPSKLQITEIRLESLFNELKEYVRTKHPGINFSIITSAPITLKVDRDRLIQVFRNLIDNAVDAQSEKIEIVAEKKNDTVVISIIDDGVGIKESDIERVFDLFFTTKKDGTGLGLAICRKIIEDHNGDIEIESAEGKGTTLKLILKTGS